MERYYRQRREVSEKLISVIFDVRLTKFQISRLYRPLNAEDALSSDEEDGDLEAGMQLLPSRPHARDVVLSPKAPTKSRLADVWDEGEELFDIGGDSGDEGDPGTPRPPPTSTPIPHLSFSKPSANASRH